MRMIVPTPLSRFSSVTYANVPQSNYPAWVSSTAYAIGANVHRGDSEFTAVAANTNVDPLTAQEVPVWVRRGAINQNKVFDGILSDPMVSSPSVPHMSVTMTLINLADHVALFNVVASDARLRVLSYDDVVLYDETLRMVDNSAIDNWHDYFFLPQLVRGEIISDNLPGYAGNKIEVTLYGPESTLKSLGEIVVGRGVELGVLCEDSSVGISDYSRKERDEWGNPVIVERPFSLRAEYELAIPSDKVRTIRDILTAVRATPVVYYEDGPAYEMGASVYGYFQDFSINLKVGDTAFMTLEVEGLV